MRVCEEEQIDRGGQSPSLLVRNTCGPAAEGREKERRGGVEWSGGEGRIGEERRGGVERRGGEGRGGEGRDVSVGRVVVGTGVSRTNDV